jgi:hypothetical protein
MTTETTAPASKPSRRTVRGFPEVAPEIPVHGEIVSWDLEGVRLPYSVLVQALDDSGLDGKAARPMLPHNAFKRAARTLTEKRIIRKVDEDEAAVRFQFTAEVRDGNQLRYDIETILTLDKETGAIASGDPDLTAKARAAFDDEVAHRNTGDVTALIQRIFADRRNPSLDLIPINKRGTYFVRKEQVEFVDKVEAFMGRLGGSLVRLPIAAGTVTGDRCVRESVAERMAGLIREIEDSVENFGTDSSERAIKNAAERVKLVRHKIASYSEYLAEEKGRLDEVLAETTLKLKAKVLGVSLAEMRGEEPDPETAPVPAATSDDVGF